MTAPHSQQLRSGDIHGAYWIVDPRGFCGVLPTAVIRRGYPNAGVRVILTVRQKSPRLAAETAGA